MVGFDSIMRRNISFIMLISGHSRVVGQDQVCGICGIYSDVYSDILYIYSVYYRINMKTIHYTYL